MSWAKNVLRRRLAAIVVGCGALSALPGCAFQPLYAARTSDGTVADALALIDVEPLDTRAGQQLRNALVFQFTRGGSAPSPVYRLVIVLKISVNKLTLEPQSGRGEAAFVQAEAVYVLKKISDDKPVFSARSTSSASFDQTEQRFANYRAEIDAEDRAMNVLAEAVRTRVAAALARKA